MTDTAWLRWKLEDPFDADEDTNTYIFVPNPNTMTSIHSGKTITATATMGVDGAQVMFEGATPPMQWTFGGDILTAVQYEMLRSWVEGPSPGVVGPPRNNWVYITDHYGRKMKVYLVKFNPTGKRAVGKAWRHTYTIDAYIIGKPSAATVGEVGA
jgi:hypothetical protein